MTCLLGKKPLKSRTKKISYFKSSPCAKSTIIPELMALMLTLQDCNTAAFVNSYKSLCSAQPHKPQSQKQDSHVMISRPCKYGLERPSLFTAGACGALWGAMPTPGNCRKGVVAHRHQPGYKRKQLPAQIPGTQWRVVLPFSLLKADQSRTHPYSSVNFLFS